MGGASAGIVEPGALLDRLEGSGLVDVVLPSRTACKTYQNRVYLRARAKGLRVATARVVEADGSVRLYVWHKRSDAC